MDLIWTAFLLGLVGSLHCAAMCGPLLLAVQRVGGSSSGPRFSRPGYQAGRVLTYIALGVIFGVAGKTLALAGLQQWLSIIAGVALLIGLIFSTRLATAVPVAKLTVRLKSAFSAQLQRRSRLAPFTLGAINGLLPCGLVYVAAAGAAATAHPFDGALHMAAFGAGTLPMMLGLSFAGSRFRFALPLRQLIPISVATVAVLLVLRGLGLGIPYLSPALHMGQSCH